MIWKQRTRLKQKHERKELKCTAVKINVGYSSHYWIVLHHPQLAETSTALWTLQPPLTVRKLGSHWYKCVLLNRGFLCHVEEKDVALDGAGSEKLATRRPGDNIDNLHKKYKDTNIRGWRRQAERRKNTAHFGFLLTHVTVNMYHGHSRILEQQKVVHSHKQTSMPKATLPCTMHTFAFHTH